MWVVERIKGISDLVINEGVYKLGHEGYFGNFTPRVGLLKVLTSQKFEMNK